MFDAYIGRRSFIQATALGAIGVNSAVGEIKNYKSSEGPAKSVTFIYLPGRS